MRREENFEPGLLSGLNVSLGEGLSTAWTKGKSVALGLGMIVIIILAVHHNAGAAPLGNPLNTIQISYPASSYAAPAGYGNLTGADGDVADPVWAACTDSGYLHFFNGGNPTPVKSVNTSIPGLTGVAYLGSDHYALSAGTTIYEGSVSGTTWNTINTINVTSSDITDIEWALNSYFIATENDNILKVLGNGGSTVVVDVDPCQAYEVIEFLPDTYNNNMSQLYEEKFKLIDSEGVPLGGVGNDLPTKWHPSSTIEGIAYYNGGIAGVWAAGVDIYNPQEYQQYMKSVIPEPSSLALLGLGGLLALYKKVKGK